MSALASKALAGLLVLACLLTACTAPAIPEGVRQAFPAAAAAERVKGKLPQDVEGVWRITGKGGELLGYWALAWGQGFNGPIQMAVAWIPGQGISHVQVVHEEETPDYGGRHLHSLWFTQQFLGNPQGREFNLVKMRRLEPQDVVIITGATASSRGAISAVNQCLLAFKELPPEED